MARRRGQIDWRYTATRRRDFMRVLAETYDLEAALAAGRLTWPEVCELRARHPDFAVRFEEVIDAGYDRLDLVVLRKAGVGAGAEPPDATLAQALIKLRRSGRGETAARASGSARLRGGRAGKPEADPERDELVARIMAKLAPLKAAAAGGAFNGHKAGHRRPGGDGGAGGQKGAGGGHPPE